MNPVWYGSTSSSKIVDRESFEAESFTSGEKAPHPP